MISRSFAAPEKSLMACPPLTYGVIGVAIFLFIFTGANGVVAVVTIVVLHPLAIAATYRDPDCAYVWLAWIAFARARLFKRIVTVFK